MDYLDCLVQALSRWNVNVTWSERNNALLYLACTESSLLGGDFEVQFQQYLPTPPFLTTSNRVLLFEKKMTFVLCVGWLILGWLFLSPITLMSVLMQYIFIYRMILPSEYPNQKRNLIAKGCLFAFSGWTNCKFNEDPWVASSHRHRLAVFSLGLLSGEPVILSWGRAVTITSILWRLHSGNRKNNPCKPHHMILEPGKSLRSNPPYFTGEESEVRRCPRSFKLIFSLMTPCSVCTRNRAHNAY